MHRSAINCVIFCIISGIIWWDDSETTQMATPPGAGLSAWISNATAAVHDAMQTAASQGSRKTKMQRQATGSGTAKSPEREEEPAVTSNFVSDMVAAAMTAMGTATENRFKTVEADVTELQGGMREVRDQISELEGRDADIQDVKLRVEAMEKAEAARNTDSENIRNEALQVLAEMRTLKDQAQAAASSAVTPPPGLSSSSTSRLSFGGSASNTTVPNGLPHELRTDAILAGLGRNLDEDTLLQRAADIFRRANIPQEWYDGMTSNYRHTAVFISFKEASHLRLASGKVRQLNATFDSMRCWLDARRTRSENKPNRAVHRCTEALLDLNSSIIKGQGQPPFDNAKIFKDMRRLQILAEEKGSVLAWWDVRRGEIMWSQEATQKYGTAGRGQDLDQISAWSAVE